MAKRNRRLLWVALALLVFVWLSISYWPFGAISPFSYLRIKLGMPFDEVEAIIGLPPGTHRARQPMGGITAAGNWGDTVAQSEFRDFGSRPQVTHRQWWGDDYAIGVFLDANGVVIG